MLNPHLDRRIPSRRTLIVLATLVMLVSLPLASVRARQAAPGPFIGTVYDVSGGVLPGVTVSLTDANQVVETVRTAASGRFEFPVVAPGRYLLDVTMPGFGALREEIDLRQPRDWQRAVTLQVGQLQESVVVRVARQVSGSAEAEPPSVIRVGGSIKVPRKVRDVKPSYPASMVAAGQQGVVSLDAVIGQDGQVSTIRVLTAQVHPDLAMAAVDAVRQWQFTPTLLNGKPVEVVMTVTVTFDLD